MTLMALIISFIIRTLSSVRRAVAERNRENTQRSWNLQKAIINISAVHKIKDDNKTNQDEVGKKFQ